MANGKKPTNAKCNCRTKSVCPLDGNCQQNDVIYKCIVSTSVNPERVYLGTAEEQFKKQHYNHNNSLRHYSYVLMKLLFLNTYGKSNINTTRYLP